MSLLNLVPWVDGLDHPECVAVDRNGNVFAGGEAGQVYAISSDGALSEVANTGGFLLGLAADSAGQLYACDMGRTEVVRIDPVSGAVASYSQGTVDVPMRTPNYPAFAADGSLFVTDSGGWQAADGLVFRIAPDGATEVWSRDLPEFPNGCCLSADGRGLIVIESTRPAVSLIPILPNGSAGDPILLAEFGKNVVPDGVAACADGSLIIGCYRPDALLLVSPAGVVDTLAEDPHGVLLAAPTNIAFAGPGRDELVVASLGRWHIARGRMDRAGLPLHFPDLG